MLRGRLEAYVETSAGTDADGLINIRAVYRSHDGKGVIKVFHLGEESLLVESLFDVIWKELGDQLKRGIKEARETTPLMLVERREM